MVFWADGLHVGQLGAPGHFFTWRHHLLICGCGDVLLILTCRSIMVTVKTILRSRISIHHPHPIFVDLVYLLLPRISCIFILIQCGQKIKYQICLVKISRVALFEIFVLHISVDSNSHKFHKTINQSVCASTFLPIRKIRIFPLAGAPVVQKVGNRQELSQ